MGYGARNFNEILIYGVWQRLYIKKRERPTFNVQHPIMNGKQDTISLRRSGLWLDKAVGRKKLCF
jgi:hypothetical protein